MLRDEETRQVAADRCVLLVDVPEDLVRPIAAALAMTVLRAKHPAAACERMVTMRPLVVVVGGEQEPDQLANVEEHALAIAAQVVVLANLGGGDKLVLHLKAARRAAEKSRTDPSEWERKT